MHSKMGTDGFKAAVAKAVANGGKVETGGKVGCG